MVLIMALNDEKDEIKETVFNFESQKIISLNKFFMKSVSLGLVFTFLLFILTVGLLIFTVIATNMDESVKITIISMVATFVLTTSKTIIDRTIEIVTYTVRILGEEQRGFNKKIGVEMGEVDFGNLSEKEEEKESQ